MMDLGKLSYSKKNYQNKKPMKTRPRPIERYLNKNK